MLFVLGNAGRDEFFRLARLPGPGETANARDVVFDLGGKGLNQAVAAARAGAAVRFVAPVGDDEAAAEIDARLAAEGIPTGDLLRRTGRSDRSVILVDAAGENLIATDARLAQSLSPADVLPRLKGLGPGDGLLMQGNLPFDTTAAAAGAAKSAGAAVILNPAPFDARFAAVGDRVDVLILNVVEAGQWTGAEDPEAAVRLLTQAVAVVTLGARGCLLRAAGGEPVRLEPPAVNAVDTTGAGDVFLGVFAAEWLAGAGAPAAARLALHAASEKVARSGTLSAVPTRADVDRLRRRLAEETSR